MEDVTDVDNAGELFDSRLQQILKNAEARICGAIVVAHNSDAQQQRFNIPRLANTLVRSRPEQRAESPSSQLPQEGPELATPRQVEPSKKARKEILKKRRAASTGSDWYNLPKTQLTTQTKRDFQLLQMRNVLDPHRHYRKTDQRGKFPQYSQVGTVVEGPTEYFSARVNKKDRANSLAADLLAGESSTARFKNKYAEIQAKSTSGRKAHYKALKAKRARHK